MKDFNLHKYLRDNRLTKERNIRSKGKINEAFEGFGGVKGIAPIQEAPIQPKDFKTTNDPWGWNDHVKKMKDDEENRANKWMMDIDRYPNPYKDWSVSWEYPGIIVWAHPDIQDAVVAATPGWDGQGTPVEFQSAAGSSQMLKVLDQDEFPSFNAYIKAIAPYLDMVEDANVNPTGEQMPQGSDEFQGIYEEGYMGTQYDSSEDMAVDMVKKGIREDDEVNETMTADKGWEWDDEDFPEEGYSNMDRMKGLVNQNHLKMFVTGAKGIMGDLLDDGFEPDEVYEFLMDTLKNVD